MLKKQALFTSLELSSIGALVKQRIKELDEKIPDLKNNEDKIKLDIAMYFESELEDLREIYRKIDNYFDS